MCACGVWICRVRCHRDGRVLSLSIASHTWLVTIFHPPGYRISVSEDGVTFDAVGGSQSSSCRYTAFSFDYLTQYQYSFLYRGGEKKKSVDHLKRHVFFFSTTLCLCQCTGWGSRSAKSLGSWRQWKLSVLILLCACLVSNSMSLGYASARKIGRRTERKEEREIVSTHVCICQPCESILIPICKIHLTKRTPFLCHVWSRSAWSSKVQICRRYSRSWMLSDRKSIYL